MTQQGHDNHTTEISFSELTVAQEHGKLRRAATALAGAGLTWMAFKHGLDSNGILDTAFAPNVPVFPEIVEGFVTANDTLRTYAPAVAAGAVATHVYKRNTSDGTNGVIRKMATGDYSGTDDLSTAEQHQSKPLRRLKRALGGVGVAALAVLITGGSSGVEREVSNGPLRAVDGMFDTLAGPNQHRSILLQGEASRLTFMDDSYISRDEMSGFVARVSAENKGVTVFPVGKALPNVDSQSAVMLSVPDELFTAATGEAVADGCDDMVMILDDAHHGPVGGEVSVNGLPVEIVGKTSGLAQMNRHVGIMPETQFDTCVRKSDDAPYFGAVVAAKDAHDLERIDTGSLNASVVSEADFKDHNLSFWQKNGTPVLFQLIAWSGVFAVAAISGERRSAMLRNIREIGTLHAQGVSMKAIGRIERARALSETLKATALAAPAMPVFAAAFNAAEMGLKVGVGVRELSVGLTVTLAAKLGGSMRAVRRFGKELPRQLAETVRG